MPPGGVGVQVQRDGAVFLNAADELGKAGGRVHAGGLRKHRCRHETLGVELADPIAEFVADGSPLGGGFEAADVVCHEGRARGEDREVDAAFVHEAQLVRLDAFPQLLVGNFQVLRPRRV